MTRRWYLHRGLAAVAYFVFAISVAFVVVVVLAENDPIAAGVVGGVSGISGVLLVFASTYREQIPIVAKWSLSPAFYLGDEIEYEALGGTRHGYVLHVSLPVVKLVLLVDGWPSGAIAEPKNTDIAAGDPERRASRLCDAGCLRLNPECVFAEAGDETRRDRRARALIL